MKKGREYSREKCTSVFMVEIDGESSAKVTFHQKTEHGLKRIACFSRGRCFATWGLQVVNGREGLVLLDVGVLMEIKSEIENSGSKLSNRASQAAISWCQSWASHFQWRAQGNIPPAWMLPKTVEADL